MCLQTHRHQVVLQQADDAWSEALSLGILRKERKLVDHGLLIADERTELLAIGSKKLSFCHGPCGQRKVTPADCVVQFSTLRGNKHQRRPSRRPTLGAPMRDYLACVYSVPATRFAITTQVICMPVHLSCELDSKPRLLDDHSGGRRK
jgi:hypothetical protein